MMDGSSMMMEIYSTQMAVAQEALPKASLTYRDIDSIGITNQRETTIVWDKETGRPGFTMRLCGNAEGLQTPLNGLEIRDI